MNKYLYYSVITIFLFSLLGCTTTVSVKPNSRFDKEHAKKIIQISLEEQQGGYNLSDIVVTDEKFTAVKTGTRRSMVAGGVAAIQSSHIVYYDRVTDFEIRKKSNCIVLIYGEGHRRLINVEFPNEEMAMRFIDAIQSMKTKP